jgi:hypothetical protein
MPIGECYYIIAPQGPSAQGLTGTEMDWSTTPRLLDDQSFADWGAEFRFDPIGCRRR